MILTCLECGHENPIPEADVARAARCERCDAELCPLDRVVDVEEARVLDALVERCPIPVLLDFGPEWCGPSQRVAEALEALAEARPGELLVVRVDPDKVPSLAERYAIRRIPTLMLFEGGALRGRLSGEMPGREIVHRLGL